MSRRTLAQILGAVAATTAQAAAGRRDEQLAQQQQDAQDQQAALQLFQLHQALQHQDYQDKLQQQQQQQEFLKQIDPTSPGYAGALANAYGPIPQGGRFDPEMVRAFLPPNRRRAAGVMRGLQGIAALQPPEASMPAGAPTVEQPSPQAVGLYGVRSLTGPISDALNQRPFAPPPEAPQPTITIPGLGKGLIPLSPRAKMSWEGQGRVLQGLMKDYEFGPEVAGPLYDEWAGGKTVDIGPVMGKLGRPWTKVRLDEAAEKAKADNEAKKWVAELRADLGSKNAEKAAKAKAQLGQLNAYGAANKERVAAGYQPYTLSELRKLIEETFTPTDEGSPPPPSGPVGTGIPDVSRTPQVTGVQGGFAQFGPGRVPTAGASPEDFARYFDQGQPATAPGAGEELNPIAKAKIAYQAAQQKLLEEKALTEDDLRELKASQIRSLIGDRTARQRLAVWNTKLKQRGLSLGDRRELETERFHDRLMDWHNYMADIASRRADQATGPGGAKGVTETSSFTQNAVNLRSKVTRAYKAYDEDLSALRKATTEAPSLHKGEDWGSFNPDQFAADDAAGAVNRKSKLYPKMRALADKYAAYKQAEGDVDTYLSSGKLPGGRTAAPKAPPQSGGAGAAGGKMTAAEYRASVAALVKSGKIAQPTDAQIQANIRKRHLQ